MDSTGKLPSGILGGNLFSLGSFDQCISIENNEKTISGKYCLLGLQMENFAKNDKALPILKDLVSNLFKNYLNRHLYIKFFTSYDCIL